MLDFKYHISSLIAVFLALAVGILLGSVIVDKGIIAKQQQTLIDSVQTDIKMVSEENEALKADIKDSVQLEKALLPLVIKKRLTGRNLIFITGDKYPDGLIGSLKQVALMSGANANFLIIQSDLGLNVKNNAATLSAILGESNSKDELKLKLIDSLAEELARGDERTLLNKLIALKIVTTDPKKPLLGGDFIFVSGSFEGFDPNNLAIPMIEALKLRTGSIIAVETEDSSSSSISAYQEAGISTIDNIDEPSGLISLVYSLSGSPGNYGSKKTADHLFPLEVAK